MKAIYQQWINENVKTYEDAYGKCFEVTEKMMKVFPELQPAYGTYFCDIWKERWHQWLVTQDGDIIDPTVSQFPTQCGIYTEKHKNELPVGKCANCGQLYYENYDGTVCNKQCADEFMRSL